MTNFDIFTKEKGLCPFAEPAVAAEMRHLFNNLNRSALVE